MEEQDLTPEMLLEDALDAFMDKRTVKAAGHRAQHVGYLAKNTERNYRGFADALKLFFAGTRLDAIGPRQLRAYQDARLDGGVTEAGEMFIRYRRPQDKKPKRGPGGAILPAVGKTPCPCGPGKVNQELIFLRMVMRHAGVQAGFVEKGVRGQVKSVHYEKLRVEVSDVRRALSPEEQQTWLQVAASDPETLVVYHYSVLAFHTCNSTDELRYLRLGDINLPQRMLTVQRGKVKSRSRSIPLMDGDAVYCLEQLIARATSLGANSMGHYLFPFREKGGRGGQWMPHRPMTVTGLRRRWRLVQERSGLDWFRMYDTRHTAITRLAENGVPIHVIKDRAGHITDRMNQHYTHISEGVQRTWLAHTMQSGGWGMPAAMMRPPQGLHAMPVGQVQGVGGVAWQQQPPQYGQPVQPSWQQPPPQVLPPLAVANGNGRGPVHNGHVPNVYAGGTGFSTAGELARY